MEEIIRETHLPRSTAYRITASLCNSGYIVHQAPGKYFTDQSLKVRSNSPYSTDNLPPIFNSLLHTLAGKLQETAFLATLRGNTISLDLISTPNALGRSYVHPGYGLRSYYACSSVKAILAFLQPSELRQFLDNTHAFTPAIPSFREFKDSLNRVRSNGFAICDGEIDQGILSFACPLINIGAMPPSSVGIVGPAPRLKSIGNTNLINALKNTRAQLIKYFQTSR